MYNYNNGFTRFYDTIEITPSGIKRYNDDNVLIDQLLSLFINENSKITCSTEPNDTYIQSNETQSITYLLTDDIQKKYYKIVLEIVDDHIEHLTLYGFSELFDNTSSEEWMKLGVLNANVESEQPLYLFYGDSGFEIIVSFNTGFYEFPNTQNIVIKSISVSRTKYLTTHYFFYNGEVLCKNVETVKYSNIPGDYCDESDILFNLSGREGMIFKYNPIFKYYENIIVSPRHVDQNNNFIMLAQKYNQNVLAKPVYLRSQYNLNNTSKNTIKDNDTVDYKIGNILDANKTHLLESVNKSMIMFGSVENTGNIDDVAIRANRINAIPTASKMLLSIEFS